MAENSKAEVPRCLTALLLLLFLRTYRSSSELKKRAGTWWRQWFRVDILSSFCSRLKPTLRQQTRASFAVIPVKLKCSWRHLLVEPLSKCPSRRASLGRHNWTRGAQGIMRHNTKPHPQRTQATRKETPSHAIFERLCLVFVFIHNCYRCSHEKSAWNEYSPDNYVR